MSRDHESAAEERFEGLETFDGFERFERFENLAIRPRAITDPAVITSSVATVAHAAPTMPIDGISRTFNAMLNASAAAHIAA
jgi:hypothetical protein